jgi:hypothetical protein
LIKFIPKIFIHVVKAKFHSIIYLAPLLFYQGKNADKHMSVTGKVINLETGKGVPGVSIKLLKMDECKEFESPFF